MNLATKSHQPLMRRLATMRTTNNPQIDQTSRSVGQQKRQWHPTVQQNTHRLMRVGNSDNNSLAAMLANISHQEGQVHDAHPRSVGPLVTVGIGPGGQPAMTLIQRQPAATVPEAPLTSVGVSSNGQIVSQATFGTAQPTMSVAPALPPAVAPVAAAAPVVQSGVTSNTSQTPADSTSSEGATSSGGGHPLSFVLAIATCTSLFIVIGYYIFYSFFWKPGRPRRRDFPRNRSETDNRTSGGQSTGHTSNSSTCGLNEKGYERESTYREKMKASTRDRTSARDRPRNSQPHRSHMPSRSSDRKERTPPVSSTSPRTRDPQAAASQAAEEHDF